MMKLGAKRTKAKSKQKVIYKYFYRKFLSEKYKHAINKNHYFVPDPHLD